MKKRTVIFLILAAIMIILLAVFIGIKTTTESDMSSVKKKYHTMT